MGVLSGLLPPGAWVPWNGQDTRRSFRTRRRDGSGHGLLERASHTCAPDPQTQMASCSYFKHVCHTFSKMA